MGTFSIWHWLIVLAVVLVLFGGGGKLSRLMADFGKGLKSFKKNIKDEKKSDAELDDPKTIDAKATEVGTDEASPKKASANKD
jgi:sec-independent protein translocase protein TatA